MKRIISWLPTLAAFTVLGMILLFVARPDLVPLPMTHGAEDLDTSRSDGEEDESAAQPDPDTLIDDGWCEAFGETGGQSDRCKLPVIRLSSPEVAAKIGLETAPVESRSAVDTVEGNAETTYDAHVFAEVIPRVRGVVRAVHVDHGQMVKTGDVLAVIDAAEVGAAKADYLAAKATLDLAQKTADRIDMLASRNAVAKARQLEAHAELNRSRAALLAAEQRLLNLGLIRDELDRIAETEETSTLLDVVSPIDGTVVEFHAVVGEALEPTTVMFQITDLSKLWAWIDVPETEFDRVRPGQSVTFHVPGMEQLQASGTVKWIDAAVNPETRTVRVLAELENDGGQLRANQFGHGEIAVSAPRDRLIIPRSAVQDFGPDVGLVFLPQGNATYRPQRIKTQNSDDSDRVEVLWGLDAGQKVVTTGSFLLLTELRRDEIAGE